MLFDLAFQRRSVFGSRIKDDVAAGDERLDIRKAVGFEQTAKMIHLDRVTAHVYGAQKGYVFWHRDCFDEEFKTD